MRAGRQSGARNGDLAQTVGDSNVMCERSPGGRRVVSHPDAPGARQRPLSDLFSLELGKATATRLRQDPDGTLRLARANLARMRQVHSDGSADPWFDTWDVLLDGPPEAVVAVLVTDDEPSRQLRQNTPFAGVLTDRERQALIRRLRASTG